MIGLLMLAAATTGQFDGNAQGADVPFLLGNWFVRQCDSPTWALSCRAYSLGLYHGQYDAPRTICLPQGVDNGQMFDVAMVYMRNHPEKGHIPGFALILASWRSAFPC